MSLYQKLLTTCKPTIIVEGSEGFISGIAEFIKKIIQKILDGIKWVWNLITGNNDKSSVSQLSKDLDAQLKKTEQHINEWAREEEKLNSSLKLTMDKSKINAVFEELNKVDLSDIKKLDEFMMDKKEEAVPALDKAMGDALGKEVWSGHKKRTGEKLKQSTGKTPSAAQVKKEAAKIGIAAVNNKPLPKRDITKMTGIAVTTDQGAWFAKRQEVLNAKKETRDNFTYSDIEKVNGSVISGFQVLRDIMIDQIKILKSIQLIPLDKMKEKGEFDVSANHAKSDVDFTNEYLNTEYRVSLDAVFKLVEGDSKYSLKAQYSKPVKVDEFTIGVNYNTFKLINENIKSLVPHFNNYETELKRITKFLQDEKSHIDKLDLTDKSGKVFKAYFDHIDKRTNITSGLVKYVKMKVDHSSDFAAAPMKHLEWD